MTLAGIIRLIDRLRTDFGKQFIITLAPVAAALMSDRPEHNLSGFSYEALEVMRGEDIGWYNTQFYCGWGDLSKTDGYDFIISRGYHPDKIVIGMVTNPGNGSGWVPFEILQEVLITLKSRYTGFGGVMVWEYFNSLPGDRARPWEWAEFMTRNLRNFPLAPATAPVSVPAVTAAPLLKQSPANVHPFMLVDDDPEAKSDAPLPREFEYYSASSDDE